MQYLSFAALLVSLLIFSGCGADATSMRLMRTEGEVGVSDDAGKSVEPRENLGLHSGYGVDTQSASFAWINLDSVTLAKLDEKSEIAIQKEDKHLEIEVKSGSLFFNVTRPLEADETMNIRTSSMVVGIRGTCGWVEVPDANHMDVYLLEGKVECTAGKTATVAAGEVGRLDETAGTVTVEPFAQDTIPDFVREELNSVPESAEPSPEPTPEPEPAERELETATDIIRLRDQYSYSKVSSYSADGELSQEVEYFPDEQGRIGKSVSHILFNGSERVSEYIYNDAGTLQTIQFENGAYSVTEDTPDHRKKEWADGTGTSRAYISYYDEQGRETRTDIFFNGELNQYDISAYDAEGKVTRKDRYLPDGSLSYYFLYEYN